MTESICHIIIEHVQNELDGKEPTIFAGKPGERLTEPPPANYDGYKVACEIMGD